ncbi:hypothetical protein [Niveibacterium sp. SC-1]|uniref:hypothetical protein n=1 Tax=Niveibacterium sp. SC-1 TaxID=3135646 RepID=UPI00311D9EC3
MLALVRPLLVPLVLILVCWFGAARWLGHGSKGIESTDLLVWFVFIPGGFLAAWFLARRAFTNRDAAPSAPAKSAPPAAAATEEASGTQPMPLFITMVRLQTAGGSSPTELLSTLSAGAPLAQPDAALVNWQGLPVLAAPVASLDTTPHETWVDRWTETRDEAPTPLLLRGLSLAAEPALECLDALCQEALEARTDAGAETQRVLLKVLAPSPLRLALDDYLQAQLATRWGEVLPIRLSAAPAQAYEDALRAAHEFAIPGPSDQCDALLILACDSLYSEDAASALASRDPSLWPGEAGVAIVLKTNPTSHTDVMARLDAPRAGRRSRALDHRGSNADDAGRLLLDCLGEAIPPETIAAVVSDCDHRVPWLVEAARAMSEHLPHLDPVADHLALGRVLGSTGAAASALALAAAANLVQERQAPVLQAVLGHDFEQSFALLTPYTPATESSTVHPADS